MNITCTVCQQDKSADKFYRGRQCKVCIIAKATAWKRLHPEREKAAHRRYRMSAKGRARERAYKRAWRKANTSSELQRGKRYIDRLPDAYIRTLLVNQHGVRKPTSEQIESHRNRVRIIRAQRAFKLLAYAASPKQSN